MSGLVAFYLNEKVYCTRIQLCKSMCVANCWKLAHVALVGVSILDGLNVSNIKSQVKDGR